MMILARALSSLALVVGVAAHAPVMSAELGGTTSGADIVDRASAGAAQSAPVAATLGREGCWARIYKEENFKGDSLMLLGPANVHRVAPDWGFSWDPQFKSVVIGAAATFTVFDDYDFRDRTATFAGGQKLADLDEHMGVFRTIRSMKLTCK